MSKYMRKMVNWVLYNGTRKPTDDISDARWHAMCTYIQREFMHP